MNDTISVTFTVKNVGDRQGSEIAQLYVRDVKSSVPRPLKELKGFDKVELEPGQSKKVVITLDHLDFSFWNPASGSWTAEPGSFEILVGSSSEKIELETKIELL